VQQEILKNFYSVRIRSKSATSDYRGNISLLGIKSYTFENMGGEMNFIIILVAVWIAFFIKRKGLFHTSKSKEVEIFSKTSSKKSKKKSKKDKIFQKVENILIQFVLMLYGFFGFDYLIFAVIGATKFTKDQ